MNRRTFVTLPLLAAIPLSVPADPLIDIDGDLLPASSFKGLFKYSVFGSVDNKLAFVERTAIIYVDENGVECTSSTNIPLDQLVGMINRSCEVGYNGVRY